MLNSWHIPNDTREAVDRLSSWHADRAQWDRQLPRWPRPRTVRDLFEARDAVRLLLAGEPERFTELRGRNCDIVIDRSGARAEPKRNRCSDSLLIATVTGLALDGRLVRLKTCPDCQWAFYDVSRNNSRVWCAMTPSGATGRGCGSIAKTNRYRRGKSSPQPETGMRHHV